MRKKIPNKVGDITKEGFVCLYGFIGTYIMRRMEERKIRISSNAAGLTLNLLEPQEKNISLAWARPSEGLKGNLNTRLCFNTYML